MHLYPNTPSVWLERISCTKKRKKCSTYKRSCKYLYMKIENIKSRCAPVFCRNPALEKRPGTQRWVHHDEDYSGQPHSPSQQRPCLMHSIKFHLVCTWIDYYCYPINKWELTNCSYAHNMYSTDMSLLIIEKIMP